jgi:hypothetical protein
MTGVAKNTVAKLRMVLGAACTVYQSKTLVNLPCKRVQCDEIWSYVGGKDKHPSQTKKEQGRGSIWTWTALCADTKLIASCLVGSGEPHVAARHPATPTAIGLRRVPLRPEPRRQRTTLGPGT